MAGRFTEEIPASAFPCEADYTEAERLDYRKAWYAPALAEAFSYGYSEHGESISPRTGRLFDDLESLNVPYGFAEAKGSMAGLVDKLFMRRDRLEHSAVLLVLRWVQRLAAELPIEILFKTLTDHTGRKARAEVLEVLQGVLVQYPDLYTEIRKIVADIHANAAAEGVVAAGSVLNKHRGVRVPDLTKTHANELAALQNSSQYAVGAVTTVTALLGGLAGDLVTHIGHLQKEETAADKIKDEITKTVQTGLGASFYIGAATHAFYGNAQLDHLRDAGEKVDFLTAGDGAVCPQCAEYEDGNPYTTETVPAVPVHGGCRCVYHVAGAIT